MNEPAGQQALFKLGARAVPVLAKGDQYIFCQDLNDVAEFVGLQGSGQARLPPAELMKKWMTVLRAARLITSGETFELGRVLNGSIPFVGTRQFNVTLKRTVMNPQPNRRGSNLSLLIRRHAQVFRESAPVTFVSQQRHSRGATSDLSITETRPVTVDCYFFQLFLFL